MPLVGSRPGTAEERLSDLEDKSIESQKNKQTENKKNKD